jgi:hypothetical protein
MQYLFTVPFLKPELYPTADTMGKSQMPISKSGAYICSIDLLGPGSAGVSPARVIVS